MSSIFQAQAGATVREMCRVTKPGGIVAATVWDFRGGLVYQRMFWDTAAVIDSAAAVVRNRLFSAPLALPEGLPNLFVEAGLRAIATRSITIRMDYAGFDDYWGPLCGGQGPVGVYVVQLAPDLRVAIEDAVRLAYCSGAADGPRSLTALTDRDGMGDVGNRRLTVEAAVDIHRRASRTSAA
jgi:hypothetical protein